MNSSNDCGPSTLHIRISTYKSALPFRLLLDTLLRSVTSIPTGAAAIVPDVVVVAHYTSQICQNIHLWLCSHTSTNKEAAYVHVHVQQPTALTLIRAHVRVGAARCAHHTTTPPHHHSTHATHTPPHTLSAAAPMSYV